MPLDMSLILPTRFFFSEKLFQFKNVHPLLCYQIQFHPSSILPFLLCFSLHLCIYLSVYINRYGNGVYDDFRRLTSGENSFDVRSSRSVGSVDLPISPSSVTAIIVMKVAATESRCCPLIVCSMPPLGENRRAMLFSQETFPPKYNCCATLPVTARLSVLIYMPTLCVAKWCFLLSKNLYESLQSM